jgi:UDP-N-acetylglucosamine--N-acetylmuramyl-(pentapeptide) pyrophosphoryl-undecaprenol N-acetylglucosamine transferase
MTKQTILIAGGGTGGHIYPGVAVARAILKENSETQIIFVGTPQGLENKIIPKEGFPLELIQVGQLNLSGNILKKLMVLIRLPLAFWQSYQIIQKYHPISVLGVGGYASGPLVLMASLLNVPTAIWEANAHPGLTNRWLSRFVRKAFVVFKESISRLNTKQIKLVGLPVRQEIEEFSLNHKIQTSGYEPFRILVFGGSQGARAINNVVAEALVKGGPWLNSLKVVHQTGSLDFPRIQEMLKGRQDVVDVREFIYDMHNHYAQADLVICRGGASTLTEVAACGKVAIVVPLPTAADNHQQRNAETLVAAEAGVMILQKDLTADVLIAEVQRLRADGGLRQKMEQRVRELFVAKAAQAMAADMLKGLNL